MKFKEFDKKIFKSYQKRFFVFPLFVISLILMLIGIISSISINSSNKIIDEVDTLLELHKYRFMFLALAIGLPIFLTTIWSVNKATLFLLDYLHLLKIIKLLHRNKYKNIKKKLNFCIKKDNFNGYNSFKEKYKKEYSDLLSENVNLYKKYKANHFNIESENKSSYTGWQFHLALLELAGNIITLLSLFLLYPLKVIIIEKYIADNSTIDGEKLIFTGTFKSLFKKYILWWLLSIVTLFIFALFIPGKLYRWKIENTHIIGKQTHSYSTRNGIKLSFIKHGCNFLSLITLGLAIPLSLKLETKYLVSTTYYDDRPLWFNAKLHGIYLRFLLWFFLGIITLTIYFYIIPNKFRKRTIENTHFENTEMLKNVEESKNNTYRSCLVYSFSTNQIEKQERRYKVVSLYQNKTFLFYPLPAILLSILLIVILLIVNIFTVNIYL